MNKKEIQLALDANAKEIKKLQKELDKLDNKFEVGKWYKKIINGDKFMFSYYDLDSPSVYGFFKGNWHDKDTIPWDWDFGKYELEEATPQEVESALIAEAKRRYGQISDGDSFSMKGGYQNQSICLYEEGTWQYELSINKLSYAYFKLFDQGQWAEILSVNTLNGKEVNIKDDVIKIGCSEGVYTKFHSMVKQLEHWNIESVNHPEIGEVKIKDLLAIISL